MNTNTSDEDTFASLQPLQLQRGVSEASETSEDFTHAEVTVLDDSDSESDSSEEAFIEVNHDDASVVSNLTVDTVMERKVKKKKKKKGAKKKGKTKAKKLASSMMHEKIEEEEEEEEDGSKSERSERTQRTAKTIKTSSSKKAKNGKLNDTNSLNDDRSTQREIIEVTTIPPVVSEKATKKIEKGHLPALTTLDTISAQPTSTNAVAGSFKP